MANKSNQENKPLTIDKLFDDIAKKITNLSPTDDAICDIIDKIMSWSSTNSDCIYRGENKNYRKISSTLYRVYFDNEDININFEDFDLRDTQKEMLDAAKKHIGEPPEVFLEDSTVAMIQDRTSLFPNQFAILTELQHYGGKTNLIDFTTCYLTAIFFACDGRPKENGRVIVLQKTEEIEKMTIRPWNPQHRVTAQQSVFIHPPKGFIDVPQDNIIIIPATLKQPMLEYLRKYYNISTGTVYNDLHGFIKYEENHHTANKQFFLGLTLQKKAYKADTQEERQETCKQAIKHYNYSIELESGYRGVYVNLGECWLHLKEWEKAREYLTIAQDMGEHIISAFRNDYRDVADFEDKTGIKLPPDLVEMLGGYL